jgi:hypothetical protein
MIAFTVQKRVTVDEALAHPYLEPVADLLQDNTKEMPRGLVMNIVPKKRDNKQKKELCQKVPPSLPSLWLSLSLDLCLSLSLCLSLCLLTSLGRSWKRSTSTLRSTAPLAASNRPPPEATRSWKSWALRKRRTTARCDCCRRMLGGEGGRGRGDGAGRCIDIEGSLFLISWSGRQTCARAD